ncbi:GNAT family N-acetyltransferase [Psychromonas sp. B3M02]|uniref:GNAT family N-acetyltransferase n=1 Tax=Psychromonas sp. B3M02 TaxID=2267226 RepID=UPI000DE91BA7|nr:GNAT family N-acetyltransferase [Psychromonas sp. B3M02]RBW42747.1 GNAT family N-acetyltransferase [Psychromonas sp. B3M02]
MNIDYKLNEAISVIQFKTLLTNTSLGERRPVDDAECLEGMLNNSNLMISAWSGDRLIGIARSVTDFHFCCYLSDLAVDANFQQLGIGKQLQIKTQEQLGPKCKLILLAAPAANLYYEGIGFSHNPRCWVLDRHEMIG